MFRALKERQNLAASPTRDHSFDGSRGFTSGYPLRAASRQKAISLHALTQLLGKFVHFIVAPMVAHVLDHLFGC